MFNKRLLFVTCLLLIILGISAVSAADISSSNETMSCAGDSTFDDVKNLLASPNDHKQVFLKNKTYVAQSNYPIEVTDNLTIFGGSHPADEATSILDAKGLTNVFNIKENCKVTFINVIITNSNSINSGAVTVGEGATVTFTTSTFTNNNGGAITVNSGAAITCNKCIFINNTAAMGGAINGVGSMNIQNSYFYNNTAIIGGGAISGGSDLTVTNSRFYKNKANAYGGAIFGYDNINIVNSDFEENIAVSGGGAISAVLSVNIGGSTFISNTGGYGGAVAIDTSVSKLPIAQATITNSLFKDNDALSGPGASIYLSGDLTLKDSSFGGDDCLGGCIIFVPAEGVVKEENNLYASNVLINNLGSNLLLSANNPKNNKVNVSIYVPVNSEGDIEVYLNRVFIKKINNLLNQSLYVVEVPNLVSGKNNISVSYDGDENYISANETISVEDNNNQNIQLSVSVDNIVYQQNAIVYITSSVNGPVDIRVGNVLGTVNIVNNKGNFTISNLGAGTYPVIVTYNGDSTHNSKTVSTILKVSPADSTINVTSSASGRDGVITFSSNMAGNFTILLNDKLYQTIFSPGGYEKITIPKLGEGNYKVTVISENSNYKQAEGSSTFTISDNFLTLVSRTIYFSQVSYIQAMAKRASDEKLIDVWVVFTINGEEIEAQTDDAGDAYLEHTFPAGYYPVSVRFKDQEAYGYSVDTGYLWVKSLIIAEDIIKNNNEQFSYSAKLIDKYGNAVSNKDMTFKINGETYTQKTNSAGVATISLKLNTGNYTMNIEANGLNTQHNVFILPSNMSALTVSSSVNLNTAEITATLSESVADANIIFTVNNDQYIIPVVGNKAVLPLNDLSNNLYRVNATLVSSKFFPISNTTSFRINIPRYELFLSANPVEIHYKDSCNVEVTLKDAINTPLENFEIIISVNGKDYTKTTNAEGRATFPIDKLDAGYYDVYVNCPGDGDYLSKTIMSSIKVLPIVMSSLVLSSKVDYNNVVITATLSEPVSGGKIVFNINGKEYLTPVNGNKAYLDITLPTKGVYKADAYLDSINFNKISNSTTFTITAIQGVLHIDAPTLEMFYLQDKQFKVTVLDDAGKPVANLPISILLNGNLKQKNTDSNGVVTMGIYLSAKVYDVVVSFDGDKKYNPISVKTSIIVKSTIIGENLVKYVRNESHFASQFLDSQGKPLNGGTAIFNINGVLYNRVLNSTGQNIFGIYLNPGKYTLTAINPSNNEMNSFNITVLSTIIVHDVTKYYANGTHFNVKVVDNHGKPLPKGTKISININGVFYNKVLNEKGEATLSIYLSPGVYIATVITDDLMTSATVTVLSTIVGEDLTMSNSNRVPFVVKVLDDQGKPAAKGTPVLFNVNGKIYEKFVNDDQGHAELTIWLRPDIYTITVKYGYLLRSYTITITPN